MRERILEKPRQMNLELTTRCPLHCPQCYVSLNNGISVTVDGKLTPCRHIEVEEEFDHIMDYWTKSPYLEELRSVEDNRREPCKGCKWEQNCLPCMAVGLKLHGELNYGMEECPLAE